MLDRHAGVAVHARLNSGDHRELHDEINEMLAVLNRGINAHILSDAHIDHGKAADIAAQLGALFLHHAFVHGHVDTTLAPGPGEPATPGPAGERR